MIDLPRRMVLMSGVALVAGGLMPGLARAAQPRVALFIMDARFEESVIASAEWERSGATLLDPREIDLGQAWYNIIPQRIKHGGIAGLTLWSDLFICEAFGRQAGLRPAAPHMRVGADLFSWSLA